jgi:hypothetical protein
MNNYSRSALVVLSAMTLLSALGCKTVPVRAIEDLGTVYAGSATTCVGQNAQILCYGAETGAGVVATDFTPTVLQVNGTIKELSLGFRSGLRTACLIADLPAAAAAAGSVLCWVGPSSPTPVSDLNGANLTGMRGISTGGDQSCAIRMQDAVVYCWSNPLGSSTLFLKTAGPVGNLGNYRMIEVASGGDFVCGVGINASTGVQQALCWGNNNVGQLGRGTAASGDFMPDPVSNLSAASQVIAGAQHACAVLQDHTMRCWGNNEAGQIGNGTVSTTGVSTPQQVTGIASPQTVSAGNAFNCALLGNVQLGAGIVKCWGSNDHGQLGVGINLVNLISGGVSVPASISIPAPVKHLGGVTSIAAGEAHACSAGLGGVHCWGDNSEGELGYATFSNCATSGFSACAIEPVP